MLRYYILLFYSTDNEIDNMRSVNISCEILNTIASIFIICCSFLCIDTFEKYTNETKCFKIK